MDLFQGRQIPLPHLIMALDNYKIICCPLLRIDSIHIAGHRPVGSGWGGGAAHLPVPGPSHLHGPGFVHLSTVYHSLAIFEIYLLIDYPAMYYVHPLLLYLRVHVFNSKSYQAPGGVP